MGSLASSSFTGCPSKLTSNRSFDVEIKQIDPFLRFGELNPDGTIKRDVRVCAVTGSVIEPGDAMIKVPDTNRFYRVKAPLLWPQNRDNFEAIRLELEAMVKPAPAISAPEAPTEIAPDAPQDIPAAKRSKGGI